jgi:DNA gyrase subunit A
MYKLKTYEIPEGGRQAKGTALVNLLKLDPGERVSAVINIKDFTDGKYLIFMTKDGIVKKTELKEYETSRSTGIASITLKENDELIGVKLTRGTTEIIAVTKLGMSIRFAESDVRPMGRATSGVKGITLNENDQGIRKEDSFIRVQSTKKRRKRNYNLQNYRKNRQPRRNEGRSRE